MEKKITDDFWDLSGFVAKSGQREEIKADFNAKPKETVLFPLNDSACSKNLSEYKASPISKCKPEEEMSYVPIGKPFIQRVALTKQNGKSASEFESDSRKYENREGTECEFFSFHSFSPTFRNLPPEAFEYYFWWRQNIKQNNPLKASWPYLSLYISEMINSEEKDVFENYISMWKLFEWYALPESEFRFEEAEAKLPEILTDYALIHNLPISKDVSENAVIAAAENARFKEIFFDSGHEVSLTVLLSDLFSDYRFEDSKFKESIRPINAKNYIYGAVKYAREKAISENYEHPLSGVFREKTTVTRFSYASLVYVLPKYTYVIKVEFCSSNRSYILRNTVSGIVKHCENRLRNHSGIKSKLRVFSLEPFFRDAVDEYLDVSLPKVKAVYREKKTELPEYEKQYELPKTEFSIEKARRIEEKSWDTTDKLTEGMEEYNAVSESKTYVKEEPKKKDDKLGGELSEILEVCPECRNFLFAIFEKKYTVAYNESVKLGIPPSVIADRINEAAFDVIGDTLLDEEDGKFSVIEDYICIFEKIGE